MESTTCGGSEKQGWSGNEVIILKRLRAKDAVRAIPTRVGKSRGHRVILSNNIDGTPTNHWVLTGYRKKKGNR